MGEQRAAASRRRRRTSAASAARRSGAGSAAAICRCGRPSCRNVGVEVEHDRARRGARRSTPSPVNVPSDGRSSTPWRSHSRLQLRPGARRRRRRTMRSWASLSQISHGARPGYLSGASARSTSAPMPSAISPIADDRPPAPQSVIAVYRPLGLAQHVDQQLLDDRVADLHAGAGDLAGGGVHRRAGERRAADAVAPGAPAEHDHAVAGVRARAAAGASAATPMQPQNTSGLAV